MSVQWMAYLVVGGPPKMSLCAMAADPGVGGWRVERRRARKAGKKQISYIRWSGTCREVWSGALGLAASR